ncbi:MAG: bacillithiol biosynthesis cysteine-adding enzyme BshC [Sphingobacteriales bacterium]|nr:bacillithiol biosynthesis cysteine-adding enzyme BshC [Sphingobacteriales bacterium]
MNFTSTRIPYRQTGAFSRIVVDYIDQAEALRPFYGEALSLQGLTSAIENRKGFPGHRELLVQELKKQYEGVVVTEMVQRNMESLLSANTFTITTAHQNNIFTGPLYFIYKILHAIKLADTLKTTLPAYHFVPVFYIGSEDADLEELNHTRVGEEELTWATKQKGAVGRMKLDKPFMELISRMEGQLAVLPYGREIISLLRSCYKEGVTLQEATFRFVNALFAEYGLLVLLPDNPALKRTMIPVFREELLQQPSAAIIGKTAAALEQAGYKVQASAREINLFYLKGDIRNRIEKKGERYQVVDTNIRFTEAEILAELEQHPGHFSPNVILRGLYEETILPNIAFIGGGGETAYWLQLKELFARYSVPFPVLVLRNSFLVVETKWQEAARKMGYTIEDFFQGEEKLLNRLVEKESPNGTTLNGSLDKLEALYDLVKKQAAAVDHSLEKHVEALKLKTVYRLQELEKKMLRAEKRKFGDQQRQIQAVRKHLFPGNGLQERTDNISYYYAKWGPGFLRKLYEASLSLEQEFVILQES